MPNAFTAPSVSTKMRHGKPNRPKRSAEISNNVFNESERDPHRFGSKEIPSYAERRKLTNNKSGFNCVPGRPPAGRLAQRPPEPSRGAGKTLRHGSEAGASAATMVRLGERTAVNHRPDRHHFGK